LVPRRLPPFRELVRNGDAAARDEVADAVAGGPGDRERAVEVEEDCLVANRHHTRADRISLARSIDVMCPMSCHTMSLALGIWAASFSACDNGALRSSAPCQSTTGTEIAAT